MSIVIRAVSANDAGALVALWEEVFPEYSDLTKPQRNPLENIERKLAMRDDLFWLAHAHDQVIGSVMAGWDGHRGWIYSLGVAHAWRGQGVGRELAQHAQHALAALGCPKINLQTRSESAIKFWRALGFVDDQVVSLGKQVSK